MNIIQGAFLFASSNKSLTLDAPTPTNISTKSEPLMIKNGTPASPATAFARSVLPVPGCPTSKTPFGICAPISVNFAGCFKNSTISSNSSFSSSTPATSSNITLFLSVGFNILALLLPNVIVLFPPWPFAVPIMNIQNIINIKSIPIGVKNVNINAHTDSDFSVTATWPFFMWSCRFSIRLSTLGIFTFFSPLSFFNLTMAEPPPASNSILSTCPASIFATNSEYVNLLFAFSTIVEIDTMIIIPIISHTANVFKLFFKIVPPLCWNLLFQSFIFV